MEIDLMDQVIVGPDGAFYPCNRFIEYSLFNQKGRVIGNVDEGINFDKLRPFRVINLGNCSDAECIGCDVAVGCGMCSGLSYDDSEIGTIFNRTKFICKMHKARTNIYFRRRQSLQNMLPGRLSVQLENLRGLIMLQNVSISMTASGCIARMGQGEQKMNTMKTFVIFIIILFWAVSGFPETITLKTADLNECIEISTFLTNTKGEIFLYSGRMSKIFKFRQNGEFEKSYCSNGIGPGEVKRALWLYYNPTNDFLYLPEFYSLIPRISIFDCEGKFKNYMEIELPPAQKDRIAKMIFLDDGSFYVVLEERIGWESHGNVYLTKDKYSLLYFDKAGKLKSKIFETIKNNEMSSGPNWGGPGILFSPSIITRSTREGNICLWKSDENILQFYSKTGVKLGITTLEINPLLLSDSEFEAAKEELVKYFDQDLRMQGLAKKMIKLKYKPIYRTFHIYNDRYVFVDFIKENAAGYTKETMLTIFDKNGKRQSSNKVNGVVMNILNNRLYVKEYDEDGNESFRLEDFKFE